MRIRRLAAAVTAAIAASAGLLVSSSPPAIAVPVLPAGFVLTESATGLADLDWITDFEYLPDGSVLSIGKAGKVAWAAADGSAARIIATLPVYSPHDLGLIGLAVAHDFAVSRRIYLAATYPVADSYLLRLAEWTVIGSPDPVGLGSARTIIELPGRHLLHGMTGLVAPSDGTLWVTIGDLIDPIVVDPTNSRPLDPNVPEGKLLHITPDGRGVPGNPFYDPANPASWRSRVYALGFRSPFRLSLDPRNGAPILGDVGQRTFEEIDYIRPGANYGWPCWEGNTPTPGYRDLPFCAGPTVNTAPLWVYDRTQGSSAIGGTFYTGDRYPPAYRGAYFFGDYSSQRIWSMQIDTQGRLTRAPELGGFGTSIGRPVKFASGPNGDIVFADIGTGRLNRLSYVPGNRPPRAVATTGTDPATRTVSFDGARSYDPDGEPLTYTWDFGDGTTGSGVTVAHTYPPSVVTATARLTVRDPAGATGTADIAVAPANHPPRLDLTAPGPQQRFAVGDTVPASATATDVEDGPLAVSWTTTLVHCSGPVCHDHPGQASQGPSYAERFPNHEDDTRMQVTATAVDSRGVVASSSFEAVPRLRTLTLTSNVPAAMVIGSQQRSSAPVVVNATISFAASTTASDGVATFDRWSDGGPQLRAGFTMPDADVTLTASFLTPIDRRFAADPALRNLIGPAIGGEQGTPTLRWRDHAYAGARLYWTAAAGVHEVHGAIIGNFQANGGHAVLGVPSTDELPTADGVGRYNHFIGSNLVGLASIYWTPSTGAHAVYGGIRGVWAGYGYERGLGYPLTDELSTPDRAGRFNHFSNGASIYWTASTGAHEVHGAIRVVWERTGWEQGLGYPQTHETPTPDGVGRYNHFSKGGSIYWTAPTGAHEVYGAIKARWAALGWERSYLGYPTSGEFSVPGGRRSNFQHGYIFWNATTGQVTDRRY